MRSLPQSAADSASTRERRKRAARVVLHRLMRSLLASLVTSFVAYVVHQLAQGETPSTLLATWKAQLLHARHGGAAATNGAKRLRTVSGKHRELVMACKEDPGKEGLEDIGGLEDVKRELRARVLRAMQYPHIFFDADAPTLTPPCRLLFHGPPGTGKTMLAKAIAREANASFFNVTLATIEDKYLGESPKIVRALFALAEEQAPCVLFFDEIDGLMRARRDDDHSSVYGLKTEMLQNLDSLQGAVVVIACTNALHSLDPALRRRLPDVFHIDRPDESQRLDILRRLTRDEAAGDEATLRRVARVCRGQTGCDLKNRFRKACASRLDRHLPTVDLSRAKNGKEVLKGLPALTDADWRMPGDAEDGKAEGGGFGGARARRDGEEEEEEEGPPSVVAAEAAAAARPTAAGGKKIMPSGEAAAAGRDERRRVARREAAKVEEVEQGAA